MKSNRAIWIVCIVVTLVQVVSWMKMHLEVPKSHPMLRNNKHNQRYDSNAIHITQPDDVTVDASYALDFWGTVNFAPVPSFQIDTHDPISQDIYISGSVHAAREPWDVFVWDKLTSILENTPAGTQPGRPPVVVDVGANIGYFSLAAAAMGARVIAFEPMSRNARKLSKSIIRNRFQDRITLYQNAAWDEGPSFPLHLEATSSTNQGNGKVVYGETSGANTHGTYGVDYVTTVSLSDVVQEDVDVIKIDTEGTEGAVISGARELICRFKVKYVIMEFTEIRTRRDKYSAENMLSFMDAAGYIVSDVTQAAPPLSISDYMNFPPNILFSLKNERAYCDSR